MQPLWLRVLVGAVALLLAIASGVLLAQRAAWEGGLMMALALVTVILLPLACTREKP